MYVFKLYHSYPDESKAENIHKKSEDKAKKMSYPSVEEEKSATKKA